MLKNAKRPNKSLDVADAHVTQETFIVQFDPGKDPATVMENLDSVGARAISTITQPFPMRGAGRWFWWRWRTLSLRTRRSRLSPECLA